MNPEKRNPDQLRSAAPKNEPPQNAVNTIKPNETTDQGIAQNIETQARKAQTSKQEDASKNLANQEVAGKNAETQLQTNAGRNLNQENQPTQDQYVQLDMFRENNVPVAEKNDPSINTPESQNSSPTPEQTLTPEIQAKIAAQDIVIKRLEGKIHRLEEALAALQNGDTSKTTPEELETLENRLPGFTNMIKERMKYLSKEIAGTDIKALQEKLQSKLESMQKLLAASEKMNKQLNPEKEKASETDNKPEEPENNKPEKPGDKKPEQEDASKETEKAKAKVVSAERSLETLNNFKEIIDELVGSLSELGVLLEKHGSVPEAEKIQIEMEIRAVIGKINQIIEQLKASEEEINQDKIDRASQIQAKIQELENDSEAEEGEHDSEIATLRAEYTTLQNEADANLTQIRGLFSQAEQRLNSGFSTSTLNEQLKQDTEQTLIKSATTVTEKFQKIEQGGKLNNLQV